ncbi:MAG: IS66 family insertion sequence element accessory protein TnpB [Pseudomonadota bacterium]
MKVFGTARPHCAYLFANRRRCWIHDGLGIWLCARRLNQGKFHWAANGHGDRVELSPEQVTALVQGLPWQRIGADGVISVV